MLKNYRHRGWLIAVSDRDENAGTLFERFIDGGSAAFAAKCELLKSGKTGNVYKISFSGKTYVLKHDLRKRHRFDYLVQSFFRGSNAFRLLRGIDAAIARRSASERGGFKPLPVAEIFLVADRRRFRCVLESFVLMEFAEGETVGSAPERVRQYGNACARVVAWLHANGMVHGDVNTENFLVAPDGTVKAIDISGKTPSAAKKAEDRIWLERLLGVKNEIKDFGFYAASLKFALRRFSRRLRGKK